MRFKQEDLASMTAKPAGERKSVAPSPAHAPSLAEAAKKKLQALGRLKAGAMNKTEAQYQMHLASRLHIGEVQWFKFEGIKLRLADNTFYTPDFAVMAADGVMELHEVKGFWLEDARVKIKIAADIYPFRFIAVRAKPKKEGGGWAVEDF